jgi:beta-galactosidase
MYNFTSYERIVRDMDSVNDNRSQLWNDKWQFALLENGSGYDKAASCKDYKAVEIPHDWLIYDTNNLYKSGEGWYKKTFTHHKDGYTYSIDFDGVYMDSSVYVNGKHAGDWHYGYSSFSFDITDLLCDGENTVMVQVRHIAPNSRWYSGAGIYRNVYLTKVSPLHIIRDGVYIVTDPDNGEIKVTVEASGEYDSALNEIFTLDGTKIAEFSGDTFTLNDYKLWDIDSPVFYTLKTSIVKDNTVTDTVTNSFGFRKTEFDPDKGFLLNGRQLKIKGVCLHHDLGALGSAVNRSALLRQLKLMKDMGANAIRTSHNMPARELIDICDRIGLLVDDESFDMWELPKTEFDNARFFKETCHADVKSWVKRDRNHPCVIMWSIGNEIYDTHVSEHGYEIAEMLAGYVREYDPDCNGAVTIGSNYIEWENAQKIGKMLVQSGYNYNEKCYDAHHEKYPHTFIYGSETSSAVRSRGIYHFPFEVPQLTHDDEQCSSLGNSCVGWGRPMDSAWIEDRNREFCGGQFVWTGIDYIGEPTPYSTKNSYFGMADTACFPKDAYYFYKSVWTDVKAEPMIHLLPYWDFNEGQPVDIIAYTNAPAAELFFNGKSFGVQKIDHKHGDVLYTHWIIPFEKGELTVNALDDNGNVIASDRQKSFGDPVKVVLSPDRTTINAAENELCFIEITLADECGTPVANARNYVKVNVSGAGRLLGLDNGDSTDYEQYKTDSRRLFGGKLLAIVGSDGTSGEIKVEVTSKGLETGTVTIVSSGNASFAVVPQITPSEHDEVPIRKIEADTCFVALNENNTSAEVKFTVLPQNATYDDITIKFVNRNGVETDIAEGEIIGNTVKVTAKGDGKCTMRIYGSNGSRYPQVISETAFEITGLGETVRDPYSMIYAESYSSSSIPVNIIERGSLGGRIEGARVDFANVDFGKSGSDTVTLYIGNNLERETSIEFFVDGKSVSALPFGFNNGWDMARPQMLKLSERITGLHCISFAFPDNVIFGGFEFTEINRAYEPLSPARCDNIYGDDYKIRENAVENIGNNVVIEFKDMDFTDGTTKLEITGRTPNDVNTIQLRYTENGLGKTQLLEFAHADDYVTRAFDLDSISGKTDVSFVFMPGSKFDFIGFRFIK